MVAESSLDTSTSFGRFAMHMMLAMAELELERIREGWDAARANAVARGVHVASRTPTGYDRDASKRLAPNHDAPMVTELFRRKARGDSWNELAAVLEGAGVMTPYGSASWTAGSMKSILENRVYLGEARSGEHVLAAAHEPLTDEVTWRSAQRVKQTPSSRKGASLLAGILRCAGCRYAMKPSRMTDRHGERLMMYSCRGKKAGGKCPTPTTVLAHLIEPYVVERVMEKAGDRSVRSVKLSEDITGAQKTVDDARTQRDLFLEADIGNTVGLDRYKAELKHRQDVLDAAEDRLAELLRRDRANDLPDAVQLRRIWPDLELEERRQLLRLGMDCVFLRRPPRRGLSAIDGRVFIAWRGEGPDDLPGRNPTVPAIRPFDW